MTLANEICSRLGRGHHKTHTSNELDGLLADARTLKEVVGEDYQHRHTIGLLIDCIRELKADPDNQEILEEALGAAQGAKTLAYDMLD